MMTQTVLAKKRRKLTISLTSLIDVVFILLVFFMLATKFEQEAFLSLDLPKKSQGNTSQASISDIVKIEVLENREVKIGNDSFFGPNVISSLRKLKEKSIVISLAPQATTQDLVSFLDLMKEEKLTNYRFSRANADQ